ncbi:hypothetical protein BABINDRAFT_89095 [Babjeviella inositovora NRRL Y-12698]|uniref:Uncharacterized protein n=1 Tax=Babjeviella inositovora NRRL Y-12698 TaxID=984486 RepID=A0A1E3QMD5_9ASCO|nr:uncharacterized protein BABINDRAFT_89095 [Babjeviella inositovora NRRL Y-12698]ODQ78252.1 hypothetical protein BABINDRAFT_89095 [Babjeviella inositovora NRRL Y-12698]
MSYGAGQNPQLRAVSLEQQTVSDHKKEYLKNCTKKICKSIGTGLRWVYMKIGPWNITPCWTLISNTLSLYRIPQALRNRLPTIEPFIIFFY